MTTYFISSPVTISAIGLAFSYLVVYKRNRLAGNIGYIISGILLVLGGQQATNTQTIGMGVFIILSGIWHGIMDIINDFKQKKKG